MPSFITYICESLKNNRSRMFLLKGETSTCLTRVSRDPDSVGSLKRSPNFSNFTRYVSKKSNYRRQRMRATGERMINGAITRNHRGRCIAPSRLLQAAECTHNAILSCAYLKGRQISRVVHYRALSHTQLSIMPRPSISAI